MSSSCPDTALVVGVKIGDAAEELVSVFPPC
jgi:hypothetical protein